MAEARSGAETEKKPLDMAKPGLIIPKKSADQYGKYYEEMMAWLEEQGAQPKEVTEEHLIEYFLPQIAKYAPNTLWTKVAALRSTFLAHHGVNLGDLPRLTKILKCKGKEHSTN